MARIRDIGIKIGDLETGELNSISDVEGTKAGHVDIDHDGTPLRTGITAVVPGEEKKTLHRKIRRQRPGRNDRLERS